MLTEPFTAIVTPRPWRNRTDVDVLDATGTIICSTFFIYQDKHGILGEIRLRNQTGTLKQSVRALSLMIKTVVNAAINQGLTHYMVEVLPSMRLFGRIIAKDVSRIDSGLLVDLKALIDSRVAADGTPTLVTDAEIDKAMVQVLVNAGTKMK